MQSAEQQQWEEIADAIRSYLAQRVQYLPAMTVSEAVSFIDAVRDARWLDVQCKTHDSDLASQAAENERSANYGG